MKISPILNKKTNGKNFFELPAEEKKKLIKKAVRGSNELQKELSIQYDKLAISKAY